MWRCALLTLVLAASATARAGDQNAVAVLDIQGTGVEPNLLPTLTEVLTAELAARGTYKVIAGRDIQSMLGFEQQKDILGCTDAACLAEIGGALGVERIVASHIGRVGSTYVVNIKLINIRMATTEARVYETVRGEVDTLIDTVRKSVAKLLGSSAAGTATTEPATTNAAPVAAAAEATVAAPKAADDDNSGAAAAQAPITVADSASGQGGGIGKVTWILWGVGVLALGTGTVTGFLAKGAERQAEPTHAGSQLKSNLAHRLALTANINFAVAAVTATAGAAWWIFVDRNKPAPTAALLPVFGPGQVGLALSTGF